MISAQGAPAVPYFGMAVFEAESLEKIMEIFKDPEYHRVVVPDEDKFFDRTKTSILTGQFATIWSQ